MEAFESVFSKNTECLVSNDDITQFLEEIEGLMPKVDTWQLRNEWSTPPELLNFFLPSYTFSAAYMSDTESDQENDNAKVDFDEMFMFKPNVGESASFALDAILQTLANDDQAYDQSMDCMHSYHTVTTLRWLFKRLALSALVGQLDLLLQEYSHGLKQRAILVFQRLGTIYALITHHRLNHCSF